MRRTSVWTSARLAHLRSAYQEEVRERGLEGARERTAYTLNTTKVAVDSVLRRLPDWQVLRAKLAAESDYKVSEIAKVPEVDPTDVRVRDLERRNLAHADEIKILRAKLRKEDREHGIVAELTTVLESNIEPIAPLALAGPPSAPPKPGQETVDAIVLLSDEHGDRVLKSEAMWGLEQYDFNTFRCRLYEWAKMIKRFTTQHLPNYFFDTLWVWKLGDSVQGDIHNMKLRNEWGNSVRAALGVGDAEAQALAYLAPHFRRIVVVCVSGNHGRTTMRIEHDAPLDNLDYLVAKTMQLRLSGTEWEERVQIVTPDSWSAHVEVRGWLWHLEHGHGIRGTWGIPWYGFERREGRVQRLLSFKDRQADYFAYGHFHTPMTRSAGKGKAIHAGPWYFTDSFSLNQISAGNLPEQQMLVVSERFGRLMEISLMLRDEERERAMRAGEWEPPFGRDLAIDDPIINIGAVGELPVIR